jgi:hypothetical protein
MPVTVVCKKCGAKGRAPNLPGKQVRCPKCGSFVVIPHPEPVEYAERDEEPKLVTTVELVDATFGHVESGSEEDSEVAEVDEPPRPPQHRKEPRAWPGRQERSPRKNSSYRRSFIAVGVLVPLAVLGLWWCEGSLDRQVQAHLTKDHRNAGLPVRVGRSPPLIGDTLVIDLRGIEGDKAPVDLFRVLMQIADVTSSEQYSKVHLCNKGKPRFALEGNTFRDAVKQYAGGQNPAFLVRTFPEKLLDPKTGERKFGSWEGGILGVLTRQMEDFNAFIREWVRDAG